MWDSAVRWKRGASAVKENVNMAIVAMLKRNVTPLVAIPTRSPTAPFA